MILTDTIAIDAAPEAVFQFFEDMERHYLQWHPDHVLFRWEKGRSVDDGNVFYFEERIAGKLLKKRVVFTHVRRPQHLAFAPTFWLMRLFLPRIQFRIEWQRTGCRVVAELHLRMGPLAAWFNRKEPAAVRDHMRVEGANLKRIVEDGIR